MKKNRNQFPFRRRIRKVTAHRQFKPLLLTVGASIFIGVTFGFIVLQMVNQEEEQDVENVQATALSVEETAENTIDLPAITVFVHQGGVFTNAENAEQYSKELQQAKVPFIQRESDEQYFIWMNIANSEQEAKSLAEKMDKQGIDMFIKEWEVPATTVALDKNTGTWLRSFLDLYDTSLETSTIDAPSWQAILEQDDLPEQLHDWQADLQQLFEDKQSDDQLLLDVLVHYENLLKDIKS